MSKLTLIIVFVFSVIKADTYILTDEQILGYEIPPSAYLEKLAESREKSADFGKKFMSIFFLGFGGLFIMSAPDAAPEAGGPGFGYFWGAVCLGVAAYQIFDLSKDEPASLSMQRYRDIANEADNDKREVLSYNALVWLAKSSENNIDRNESRNTSGKPSIKSLLAGILVESALKKSNIFSVEQRALDGFLTQTPLDVVF